VSAAIFARHRKSFTQAGEYRIEIFATFFQQRTVVDWKWICDIQNNAVLWHHHCSLFQSICAWYESGQSAKSAAYIIDVSVGDGIVSL